MRFEGLSPDKRAAIEREIRNYPLTKTLIKERRQEILDSGSLKVDAPPRSGLSDPTCGKAMKLCSEDIAEMEWVCSAIEDVYRVSSKETQRVIELYYWRSLRHYEVAYEIGVSERTLRRMREEIVSMVAYRMGAIRPGTAWWRRGRPVPVQQ
jgi:RinA family phage transcriptional activator